MARSAKLSGPAQIVRRNVPRGKLGAREAPVRTSLRATETSGENSYLSILLVKGRATASNIAQPDRVCARRRFRSVTIEALAACIRRGAVRADDPDRHRRMCMSVLTGGRRLWPQEGGKGRRPQAMRFNETPTCTPRSRRQSPMAQHIDVKNTLRIVRAPQSLRRARNCPDQ